jgi:hypothetical protein
MRRTIALIFVLLAGCAHPETYYLYWPEASWGQLRGVAGSVPTPTIGLDRTEYPGFGLNVYMGTEPVGREVTPKLFIVLWKGDPPALSRLFTDLFTSQASEKKRKMTLLRVKANSAAVKVELQDGSSQIFEVPELTRDISFVGEHWWQRIEIELKGVKSQSLLVHVPSFVVNDQLIETGAVKFNYRKERHWTS